MVWKGDELMDRKLVVAIDGPAGAGKSTTAKELALRLGYRYIDTGAMYRAITLLALNQGIAMDCDEELTRLAKDAVINFAPLTKDGNFVYLNGQDVTDDIRTSRVNENVSFVARVPGVRHALVIKQRKMAEDGGVIMDGRDIGTVVLPEADLKIFLTASLATRAQRRLDELQDKGEQVEYSSIKDNLETRDSIDSCREVAPLKKADEAIGIDTTGYTIDEVVEKIMQLMQEV